MVSPEVVEEAGAEDAPLADPSTLEAVDEAVVEVWEFTPRRAPTSVPTSPRTLPLDPELVVEAGTVEA
jgi:hypothetical protein